MREIIPVLSAMVVGCTIQLPPAATPQARTPALVPADSPPPEGHGRIVLDVVDGPTPIELVRMVPEPSDDGHGRTTFHFREHAEPLCTAPCRTDPPLGNLLVGFPVVGDP